MKCMYIYNPKSGKQGQKRRREYVEDRLKSKFSEVLVKETTCRGDAGRFAKEACGVYDVLVVSGGDGTLNEVVNAIATEEVKPKIGYLPTGTTNDLAHSLKIPKNIKKAVDIVLNGKSTKHDIIKINDKFAIYVCAFGAFTAASYTAGQKSKKRFGKLAYYANGIREIKHTNKFFMRLKTDVIEFESDIILGIIANSRYVSGFKINKMADHQDGNVNVILFKEHKRKGISLKMLFNIARTFLFGITTLKNSKNCVVLKLNKFSVEFEEDVAINLDGEKGFKGSFDLEVLKQHVEIFVKG